MWSTCDIEIGKLSVFVCTKSTIGPKLNEVIPRRSMFLLHTPRWRLQIVVNIWITISSFIYIVLTKYQSGDIRILPVYKQDTGEGKGGLQNLFPATIGLTTIDQMSCKLVFITTPFFWKSFLSSTTSFAVLKWQLIHLAVSHLTQSWEFSLMFAVKNDHFQTIILILVVVVIPRD